MEAALTERAGLSGVISCFDRVVLTGTLPDICYAEGMAAHLTAHDVRLFDFPRWAASALVRIARGVLVRSGPLA